MIRRMVLKDCIGREDEILCGPLSVHLKNGPIKAESHGPGRYEVKHTGGAQASLDGTQVLLSCRYFASLCYLVSSKMKRKNACEGQTTGIHYYYL